MAANKVSGIRCALCWDEKTGRLAKEHNNANALSLGQRQITRYGLVHSFDMVRAEFEGGRHERRIGFDRNCLILTTTLFQFIPMPKKEETKPEDISTVIQKKFLEERKIFLWGEVSDKSAKDITEKLLCLEWTDPGKKYHFYINTPGGSITAGMAIFDTMKMITSPMMQSLLQGWLQAWVRFFSAALPKAVGTFTPTLG